MTQIVIKRVYETPSLTDGFRVLVDRLWPRGMKHESLELGYWAKELAPSNELRKWFQIDTEKRWGAFVDMYQKELERSSGVKSFIDNIKLCKKVTLLYASKDVEHNHARALEQYLGTLF